MYTIYTEIGQLCKVISTAVFTNHESKPAQTGHLVGLSEAKGSSKIEPISRSVLFTLKQMSQLICVFLTASTSIQGPTEMVCISQVGFYTLCISLGAKLSLRKQCQ